MLKLLSWWETVFMGYTLMLGTFIVFFATFTVAYLNGFRVLVTINSFGEAHLEWWMMCILMCFYLIGLYGVFRIRKEGKLK